MGAFFCAFAWERKAKLCYGRRNVQQSCTSGCGIWERTANAVLREDGTQSGKRERAAELHFGMRDLGMHCQCSASGGRNAKRKNGTCSRATLRDVGSPSRLGFERRDLRTLREMRIEIVELTAGFFPSLAMPSIPASQSGAERNVPYSFTYLVAWRCQVFPTPEERRSRTFSSFKRSVIFPEAKLGFAFPHPEVERSETFRYLVARRRLAFPHPEAKLRFAFHLFAYKKADACASAL